jgi:hypothetical protein
MRRFPFGLTAVLLLTPLLSLVLVGCGGPIDEPDGPLPRRDRGKASKFVSTKVEALKPLPVAKDKYTGVIRGQVKWAGEKPDFDKLTKDLQAGIIKDRNYCLQGQDPESFEPIKDYETFQQTFRIGKNGNLGNVFVWIQAPPDYTFVVPDDQLPKVKDVRLHQPHCAFLPHCAVVFASRYNTKTGDEDPAGCQKLVIENNARISHNAKVQGGPINGSVNKLLRAWDGKDKKDDLELELKPENAPISVACDVHTWMRAWVRVFDHPYAAVTSVGAKLDGDKKVWENLDADDFGKFEIKGAPIGAKVRLFVWHESLGYLTGANGKEITISADPKQNEQDIPAGK